jgi:Uncharacterized protein conserved in bacteria
MPASTAAIVQAATDEWNYWGKSTWNCITGAKSTGYHIDDDVPYAKYIINKYLALFYNPPTAGPSVQDIAGDVYPWSAVTISYIMKTAGFTKEEFPFSQAHAKYLVWGIKNRNDEVQNAAYWGYRVDDDLALPDVGDLVGCARAEHRLTRDEALAYFARTGSYASHSDIVVAKRPGEIDVIGGNVRDSVTKKTLKLNAKGQLIDNLHDWFVVLRRHN